MEKTNNGNGLKHYRKDYRKFLEHHMRRHELKNRIFIGKVKLKKKRKENMKAD